MKNSGVYEIDLNKALSFIFASVIMTALSIWVFIVPVMESYKISKITNRHAKIKFTQASEYYKERVDKLSSLTRKNKRAIEALNADLERKIFLLENTKNMSDVKIKYAKPEEYGIYYNATDIHVNGKIPFPKKFFDTLYGYNKYQNLLSVEFPVKIALVNGSSELTVSYPVKLFNIKDLNASYDTLKSSYSGQNQ